jgi:hypothetical protein
MTGRYRYRLQQLGRVIFSTMAPQRCRVTVTLGKPNADLCNCTCACTATCLLTQHDASNTARLPQQAGTSLRQIIAAVGDAPRQHCRQRAAGCTSCTSRHRGMLQQLPAAAAAQHHPGAQVPAGMPAPSLRRLPILQPKAGWIAAVLTGCHVGRWCRIV